MYEFNFDFYRDRLFNFYMVKDERFIRLYKLAVKED